MFFNTFKSRLSLCFKQNGFLFSMTLMMIFSVGTFIYNALHFKNLDTSQIIGATNLLATSARSVYIGYFEMLFPFIAIMPFCFSYITDRQQNNISVISIRGSRKSYYFSSLLTAFIGGFLIIFIPLLVNFILNVTTFPLDSMLDDTNMNTYSFSHITEYWKKYVFAYLYVKNPVIHNLLFILIPSVFSGNVCVFVYAVSFFFKRYKLLLFLPFYAVHYVLSALESKFKINVYYFRYITQLEVLNGKSVGFFIFFNVMLVGISLIILLRKIKSDEL
ncbi:MAG: hypothetical protein IJ401_00045 [Oscillospiraceae bacterium]|nr:hypothetical protein [Oscillospiraceae bacterium]